MFKTRAFYGDFKISAEIDGARVEKTFSHLQDGDVVEIELPVTTTGVNDAQTAPLVFRLGAVYPNPFNSQTRLVFDLPSSGRVQLQIVDAVGRGIVTLMDSQAQAGQHTLVWNGENADRLAVSSGVYFCRLCFGGESRTAKILLLK